MILKIIIILLMIIYFINCTSNQSECAEFRYQTGCYCDLTYLICDNTNITKIPNNLPQNYFKQVSFRNTKISQIQQKDLEYLKIDTWSNTSDKRIIFHLDFDNINNIDDSSFELFSMNLKDPFKLNIRFRNSNLGLSINKRPFKALKMNILVLKDLKNDYIANPLFDECSINELHIEDSINFVGFIDLGDNLPTGRLTRAFYAYNSYKDNILCSHSLPAFIDHENFSEINIQKCNSIQLIKNFAFYKYNHLKILILASNNISFIEKNSFRNLNELEFLSLSYNPIGYLPDFVFSDLISLKRLDLEGTNIKFIAQKTFAGLFSLIELRLTFSKKLNYIENCAFDDSKKTLKVLFMENIDMQLISSTSNIEWLRGLNLTNLVIDFSMDKNLTSKFFTDYQKSDLFCKFIKTYPRKILLNLNPNEDCNCLTYWLYENKNFEQFYSRFDKDLTRHWIYATPRCYRIQTHNPNDRRKLNFTSIIENERYCNFRKYELKCLPTTKTQFSTTTSSTTSMTTSIISTSEISSTTMITKRKVKQNISKIDIKKLIYVITTIVVISLLAIVLTIIVLRLNAILKERKRNTMRRRGGLVPRSSYLIRNPKQTSQRSSQQQSLKQQQKEIVQPINLTLSDE